METFFGLCGTQTFLGLSGTQAFFGSFWRGGGRREIEHVINDELSCVLGGTPKICWPQEEDLVTQVQRLILFLDRPVLLVCSDEEQVQAVLKALTLKVAMARLEFTT